MEAKHLNRPLLKLSRKDAFSLKEAYGCALVVGEVGAGKTSGGRLIAALRPEEGEPFRHSAKELERGDTLLPFDEDETP